jgi:hypothetical protein
MAHLVGIYLRGSGTAWCSTCRRIRCISKHFRRLPAARAGRGSWGQRGGNDFLFSFWAAGRKCTYREVASPWPGHGLLSRVARRKARAKAETDATDKLEDEILKTSVHPHDPRSQGSTSTAHVTSTPMRVCTKSILIDGSSVEVILNRCVTIGEIKWPNSVSLPYGWCRL